jgi:hypothetical protein
LGGAEPDDSERHAFGDHARSGPRLEPLASALDMLMRRDLRDAHGLRDVGVGASEGNQPQRVNFARRQTGRRRRKRVGWPEGAYAGEQALAREAEMRAALRGQQWRSADQTDEAVAGSTAGDRHHQALPPAILQDKAAKPLAPDRVQQPMTPEIGPCERRAKVAESFDDRVPLDKVRRPIELKKFLRPLDDVKNGEALVIEVDFATGEDINVVRGDKSFEERGARIDVAALLQRAVKFDRAWFRKLPARARLRHRNGNMKRAIQPPQGFTLA